MAIRCCIPGCKSEKIPGCKITFHCFPKDEQLRTKWTDAIGIARNLKNKMVCSLHFNNDAFTVRGSLTRLKRNVIPTYTIPPFNTHAYDSTGTSISDVTGADEDTGCDENGWDDEIKSDGGDLDGDKQLLVTESQAGTEYALQCQCCLRRGRLRSLWREPRSGPAYGAMLLHCFALPWGAPADADAAASAERICGACVRRLRDAARFREEVLAAHRLLAGRNVDEDKLKHERETTPRLQAGSRGEDGCSDGGDGEVGVKIETFQSSPDPTSDIEEFSRTKPPRTARKRKAFAAEVEEAVASDSTRVRRNKVSKKTMSCDLKNNSKIYIDSQEDIKDGIPFVDIEKVIADNLDHTQLTGWVKEEDSASVSSRVKETNSKRTGENRLSEMKKQANNIAVILEHTNATPIRRHGGIGYGCCFCASEYPDPADLKDHTLKTHDVKTKRNYAKGKRPSAYLVKLDITGLKCVICDSPIGSLEQLYDHLTEAHKKILYRNAKNYIIPFKFEGELKCISCEFMCNSFKGLLEHMSVHYRNHVCEICDTGFLTKNNLFNHHGRHKKGVFKCDFCDKVFDTASKKAGHQRLVHSCKGVNRCGYCGEMFGTYRRKEKHLMTVHGVTLRKLQCKACEKTFETQTALRVHTKRDHLIERRFQCAACDKRCFTGVQLAQHALKHTGERRHRCGVCRKAYGRKSTLREHMRIHENDRRFACALCGAAFVQKCSWRAHLLAKHGRRG